MTIAHFSRVVDDTDWNNLLETMRAQKENNCKPLKYKVVAEISLPPLEFDMLTDNLAKSAPFYLQYANQSVPDTYGVWGCILIDNQSDNRKIAVYTAGRTFPLYAAIIK